MHVPAVLAVVAFVLLRAGCTGGSDREGDVAVRPPTGTPAVTATVERTLSPTPAPTPSPTAARIPTPAPRVTATPAASPAAAASVDLTRALLALEDMPADWRSAASDGGTAQPCGQRPALSTQAARQVEASYQRGSLGPFVSHTVASYRPGDAARAMDSTRRLFEECREWEGSHLGSQFTFRVSTLPFPDLGDQSFALRLDADGPLLLVAQTDLVFVRRGNVAFLLAHTTAGLRVASIDSELTERLTRRADQLLEAIARGP